MSASAMCECKACGYEWERGKNGSHSCADKLRDTVKDLRFRLQIAEDGWTRARLDTDRMTREIEGLREVVEAARRLKNGMKSDYATNQHAPIYEHRQALADLILAFGRLNGEEVAG